MSRSSDLSESEDANVRAHLESGQVLMVNEVDGHTVTTRDRKSRMWGVLAAFSPECGYGFGISWE